MKIVKIPVVQLHKGDQVIGKKANGDYVIKTSEEVSVFTYDEVKEIYAVNPERIDFLLEGGVKENPQDEKANIIAFIQGVVHKYGTFTTADVNADCSPCINNIGETSILAEEFLHHKAKLISYVGEMETGEELISYQDLDLEVLEAIKELADDWKEKVLEDFDEGIVKEYSNCCDAPVRKCMIEDANGTDLHDGKECTNCKEENPETYFE